MVSIQMKVGPKGQVVIPKVFRKEFSIMPGNKVIMEETKEGISIKKPEISGIDGFIALSKKIKKSIDIDMDAEYEEEIEERWRKSK